MAQAGLHGLAGLAVKRWTPDSEWLLVGIVLGNLAPDVDNVAVAVATVTGGATARLHRTFTHSLFTVAAVVALGYLVAGITRQQRWRNLGLGLGVGIVMHILVDLLIWFDGVQLLWPLPLWINLWGAVQPPAWWQQLMMPAEFLALALYFWALGHMARRAQTDGDVLGRLRFWLIVQGLLFAVFTVLVFVMDSGFMTVYGVIYLLSLGLALGVTIRMRGTIEARGVRMAGAAAGSAG